MDATNRYRQLINEAGGTYSTSEVAELLNTTQIDVKERKERGDLLGINLSNSIRFPVWQFNKSGSVLSHFTEILLLLKTNSGAAKVRFFLSQHESFPNSVINALQSDENLALIKRAAHNFGVHGAI